MYPSSPSRPMAPGLARYDSAPSSLLNRHLQSLVPNSDAGFLAHLFPAPGYSVCTEQSSSGTLERSSSVTAPPASSSLPTALARHSSSPTAAFLSHLALDNNGESPTSFSRLLFFFFFFFVLLLVAGIGSRRNRPAAATPKNPATFSREPPKSQHGDAADRDGGPRHHHERFESPTRKILAQNSIQSDKKRLPFFIFG